MIKNSSHRLVYFIGFLFIAALLGAMTYLELYQGFTPCALCILQRFVFGILGVFFLIGSILSGLISRRVIAILSALTSLCGIAFAGRQVWLQHFPHSVNGNCEVSLRYMLKALPLDEVIHKVFSGGAECTQVGWSFMNISLAEWSLVGFILFFLMSLWQLRR